MEQALLSVQAKVKPLLRGVSHQVAFFFALAGGAWLVTTAPTRQAALAGLIYSLSLAGMYGFSALYHRPMWSVAARKRMRRLDHAGIFFLIAGSYTPVCMLGLGQKGTLLLTIAWSGAVLGFLHAAFFVHAFRTLNAVLCVALGCAAVPFLPSMWHVLGLTRTLLLAGGGAVYILGAVVYSRRWPNPFPRVFGYHEVFHLMVIAASVVHFAVMVDLVRNAS